MDLVSEIKLIVNSQGRLTIHSSRRAKFPTPIANKFALGILEMFSDTHFFCPAWADPGTRLALRWPEDNSMRISNIGFRSRSSAVGTIGNVLAGFLLFVACSHFAFSQTPTTPEGYVEVGVKLVQVGHLDNAIAFFTKAIELKPDLADAYNNRGFVYQKQNKWQLALADFTKAI